jgi:glyoxylase-like metal-dependent hydrolase (beta-lactamase superfamily II)
MNVLRLAFLFTMVLLLSACAHAEGPAAAAPRVEQPPAVPAPFTLFELASGTHLLHEAEPWATNVLLVEMPDDSFVLVNAPATEASTRVLLGYLEARFGQRRLTVINSHHHIDSVGGNALLLERGAEVIASAQTAALIVTDTPDDIVHILRDQLVPPQFEPDFKETRLAQPSRTFDAAAGLTLRFGAEEVRIFHPGAAHSIDNVVVFFPSRALLFGGCMVRSGDSLGPAEGADYAQWPSAIARLQSLQPKLVVPGHGARFDAKQLDDTLELLRAAR